MPHHGAVRLAHAALERVLECHVEQSAQRELLRLVDGRLHREPLGQRAHVPRVPPLIVSADARPLDQLVGCPQRGELRGHALERVHGSRFEARHLRKVAAHVGACRRARRNSRPLGHAPADWAGVFLDEVLLEDPDLTSLTHENRPSEEVEAAGPAGTKDFETTSHVPHAIGADAHLRITRTVDVVVDREREERRLRRAGDRESDHVGERDSLDDASAADKDREPLVSIETCVTHTAIRVPALDAEFSGEVGRKTAARAPCVRDQTLNPRWQRQAGQLDRSTVDRHRPFSLVPGLAAGRCTPTPSRHAQARGSRGSQRDAAQRVSKDVEAIRAHGVVQRLHDEPPTRRSEPICSPRGQPTPPRMGAHIHTVANIALLAHDVRLPGAECHGSCVVLSYESF